MEGDVSTLPSWAGMGALQLEPFEDLVVSSEDVRCFFYIFSVPSQWHGFLAFNRPLPESLKGRRPGNYYLCSTVLPLGFKNSVSLAQHVHRFVVKQALHANPALGSLEKEIRKDRHFPSGNSYFRVYLDNFDELRKVNKSLSDAVSGKVSPLVLGLREEYLRRGIPRHPKKSIEQQSVAEVQGAIIHGQDGLAFPKPDKVMRYCKLGLLLLQQTDCTQRQLQVVAGGFVYMAMFRRPLLGALNNVWRAIIAFQGYPPLVRLPIPWLVKMEIPRFICLCPLAVVNFRTSLSPQVTASAASEFGGGVTASTGLTESGVVAAGCDVRGDVPEPQELTGVVTIGLFDGISALRVAVDSLGWNVIGHVSVECSTEAQRVVESRFPSTVHVKDVAQVTSETVLEWSCMFSQAALVVIGAGPPCQGVSGLNVDRKGALKDHRSCLYQHVSRIRSLVQRHFPWARVSSLVESVASMDTADMNHMSDNYGDSPFLVDAKDFSLARRPRFYWLDWELLPQQGVSISDCGDPERRHKVVTACSELDEHDYLSPGWSRYVAEPLPTFTTSRCRDSPGRRPAGLHLCQQHEID
eukprot:Skav220955  [mRNA]  locus=scaffold1928:73577:75316:+ [translate_table: standard]